MLLLCKVYNFDSFLWFTVYHFNANGLNFGVFNVVHTVNGMYLATLE